MNGEKQARIYEFPLSSRMRYFLRCESIARSLEAKIKQLDGPDTNVEALRLLFELMELTRNMDLKSETMQHIRWQIQELQKLDSLPKINRDTLHSVIAGKEQLLLSLENTARHETNQRDHHFLSAVKRRLNIPGGICSFDIPALSAWLDLPFEQRLSDIRKWHKPFADLYAGIYDCLALTRSSEKFEERTAETGYYSQTFDNPGKTYQMLRIKMDQPDGVFPEVSAGKPRFTIHFFVLGDLQGRPRQVKDTVNFQIAFCRF